MTAIKAPGTRGNCSVFHSDIQSSKAHSLKINIKSLSYVSKGLIRKVFEINLKQANKKAW